MKIDKTYSELWDLVNTHEDEIVKETAKMAINTLQKLQKEHEKEYDRLRKQIYELAEEKHVAYMKLNKATEKSFRYEKALKVIAEHTTCDDTWDFTNRLLEGKEMTGLPYRFNLD